MDGRNANFELATADIVLRGRSWPSERPRAVIALAHGINEHSGRYQHVGSALNAAGFSAVALDHRGHGLSAVDGKRSSNIRRFDTMVDDYIALIDHLKVTQDRPVVALGHSMGGLIVTRAGLRAQDRMAAMVLSGPALKLPMPLSAIQLRVFLALSRIAPFLKAPVGDDDRLSRDPTVRQSFRDDPLCIQESIRLGIARQIYLLSEETRKRAGEIRLPLLVMHGAADQITAPEGSREFVERAQSADKEFVSWPDDLHEIFNELDRFAVLARMNSWLEDRFPLPADS